MGHWWKILLPLVAIPCGVAGEDYYIKTAENFYPAEQIWLREKTVEFLPSKEKGWFLLPLSQVEWVAQTQVGDRLNYLYRTPTFNYHKESDLDPAQQYRLSVLQSLEETEGEAPPEVIALLKKPMERPEVSQPDPVTPEVAPSPTSELPISEASLSLFTSAITPTTPAPFGPMDLIRVEGPATTTTVLQAMKNSVKDGLLGFLNSAKEGIVNSANEQLAEAGREGVYSVKEVIAGEKGKAKVATPGENAVKTDYGWEHIFFTKERVKEAAVNEALNSK